MIDPALLLMAALSLCGLGALIALVLPQHRNPPAVALAGSAASICLLWATAQTLIAGRGFQISLWELPALGTMSLALDRLSALFLLVGGLVFLPVSVFSAGYLKRYQRHYSLKAFSVLYLALFASIILILIAHDIVSFLLAWEVMSIVSYLLVNYEHRREEHTRAGYLMLAMGEAGTLAAAAALLMLAGAAGSVAFPELKLNGAGIDDRARWGVFLLSFFGFGVKAGLVPFNSWLPRAHPAAPANVSALLSGLILNLGLYGIVRVNLDILPASATGPGLVALITGTISAFVGILYATTENDLKIMLAHSSIENMGIVVAGLGAGLIFVAAGRNAAAGIAFVAAFYHMTNHSLYKALLFLGAGTVDYRVGTRNLDRLGGLIRRMPWTAFFFLVGALSISALYPFNGFISEWLTLQSLLRSAELSSASVKLVFALCGAGLALTAALAITCFVKAFAMGFLGMPRSRRATRAVEAPRAIVVPMGILAALCLLLGIVPTYVIPTLDSVITPFAGASAQQALVPPFFTSAPDHAQLPREFAAEFHDLGAQTGDGVLPGSSMVVLHRGGTENPVVFASAPFYGFFVLLLLLAITAAVARWLTRKRTVARNVCWDGGIRRLLPAMTYTATGFSNPVRVVFNAILRPQTVEDSEETVAEHFRTAIRRTIEEAHLADRFLFGFIVPGAKALARLLATMHHGRVNAYVAYVLVTLLVFLVAAAYV